MNWVAGDEGVVELPDGRMFRGRGLRVRAGSTAKTQEPEFGVYLLGRSPTLSWNHEWIRCRDFGTPSDTQQAVQVLQEAYERGATERVEVGCGGGIGRTGTALAVIAILGGIEPESSVQWVRDKYHPRAIETPWQRRWVLRTASQLKRQPLGNNTTLFN
jgi:protein-tyrosine phosphatase